MNYKAQLLHLKAQRKRRKHERVFDVELPGRNIDVISRLIDYQLDHIAIKVCFITMLRSNKESQLF